MSGIRVLSRIGWGLMWIFYNRSALELVASVARLGVGTAQDVAKRFDLDVRDVELLLEAAECRGLLSSTTSWRCPVPLVFVTDEGLSEVAKRGLVAANLGRLGALALSERNVGQVFGRMRMTLRVEGLGLQVTSFRELVAGLDCAERGTDREMDPPAEKRLRAPLSLLRPPDIRVQSPDCVRGLAIEVLTSKAGADAIARRYVAEERGEEVGVVWVSPRGWIAELRSVIKSVCGEECLVESSVEDAIAAVFGGRKHVVIVLDGSVNHYKKWEYRYECCGRS